jgi:hypothetical protein
LDYEIDQVLLAYRIARQRGITAKNTVFMGASAGGALCLLAAEKLISEVRYHYLLYVDPVYQVGLNTSIVVFFFFCIFFFFFFVFFLFVFPSMPDVSFVTGQGTSASRRNGTLEPVGLMDPSRREPRKLQILRDQP